MDTSRGTSRTFAAPGFASSSASLPGRPPLCGRWRASSSTIFPGLRWRVSPGWKTRKDSQKVYTVAGDGGDGFFTRREGSRIQAGKAFELNLKSTGVAWAWRPVEFPKGADERTDKNDSAVAVYAVFPHTQWSVKSVKYIWSEKVPKGTHIPQSRGNTQGVVLRTGGAVGQWTDERVNVLEGYKRYFKTDEVPKPEGLAVLTDSDDTSSRAVRLREVPLCRDSPC